jgi:hypothetical protein
VNRVNSLLFGLAGLLLIAGIAWFSPGAALITTGLLVGVAGVALIEVDR